MQFKLSTAENPKEKVVKRRKSKSKSPNKFENCEKNCKLVDFKQLDARNNLQLIDFVPLNK